MPVRNSLTFNRFIVHPTFSFVREQNKFITATNKREFVGVEDAPTTYLVGYSGRFRENIGAGVQFFQQNYGVLTTFGGVLNFAYNARLEEYSNLTFGLNIGAYQSGLNNGRVVVNFDDPILNTIPSNFLITANPGINYGSGFLDFGLSYTNLFTYNFNTSALLDENPKSGLQGHFMYTGYFGGYGFFGESKFSALARAEFQDDNTILSGLVMLTVPKGIWAQVGYNTNFGASVGLGVNITSQFAIEYNYEKAISGFSDFGASHEITLAYRFKKNTYYDYGGDDEVAGLINFDKKEKQSRSVQATETKVVESEIEPQTNAEEQARIAAAEQERLAQEEATRLAQEEQLRLEAEEQSRLAAEEQARIAAAEQERLAQEEAARLAQEEQLRLEAEEQSRLAAEEQARIAAAEQERLAQEEAARLAQEEQLRLEAEEQSRLAAEEQARIAAAEQERLAQEEATRLAQEEANIEKQPIATDKIGVELQNLTEDTDNDIKIQSKLLKDLEAAVAIKENDLNELKEENDLSEQNIYVAPKPFKSVRKENERIELLKIDLDTIILRQNKRISELETLVQQRTKLIKDPNDEINSYYQNKLSELKRENEIAVRKREELVSSLKQISIATEIERKRRIKRATYDNDKDRYTQDRQTLKSLKQTIPVNSKTLLVEDLDFGRNRNNNIQILKNIQHTESGYYLVLAVHSSVKKRDEFLVQVIASGNKEIDFFFDVNTSEYYIYSQKFSSITEAEQAIASKKDKAYYENINIVKIEN